MKRTAFISLVLMLAIVVGLMSGCINVFPTGGNLVNPYVEWNALDSIDLTPAVDRIAELITQLEDLRGQLEL